MKFTCPSCQTTYNLDEKRIPPSGAKLKCAKCQTSFPVKLATTSSSDAIPLPASDHSRSATTEMPPAMSSALRDSAANPFGGEAIPLPSSSRAVDYGFDAPQSASPEDGGAIPLPASEPSDAGAIPLAGDSDFAEAHDVVALPGAEPAYGDAIPLPGQPAFGASEDEVPFADSQVAIPVPDFGAPPADEFDAPTSMVNVPPEAPADFAFGAPAEEAAPAFASVPAETEAPYAASSDFAFGPPAAEAPPPHEVGFGDEADFDQPTRVMTLPPEAPVAQPEPEPAHDDFSFGEAVPLPSQHAPSEAAPLHDDFTFGDPVPLPSQQPAEVLAPPPPPIDEFGADPGFDESTRVVPNAAQIALEPPPSEDFGYAAAEPIALAPPPQDPVTDFGAEADFDAATRMVPIPANVAAAPPPSADPFAFADSAPAADVPLPSPGFGEEVGFDEPTRVGMIPAELLNAAPSVPSAPPPTFSLPPIQPVAPVSAEPAFGEEQSEVDFDQPTRVMSTAAISAAAGGSDPFAAAAPEADPFATAAPPPAEAPSDDPFAAIQTAVAESQAPAPAPLQFEDLPAPSGPDPFANVSTDAAAPASDDPFAAIDTGAPPAPAPVDLSQDFGGVDLGGDPEPAPASKAPAHDDDPFASVPVHTGQAETPRPASGGRRFHVRRRSGKTFGPFDESSINKMLEDGQLLGNEDVSEDNASWTAIGSVPAFGPAVAKAAQQGQAKASGASDEQLEKLRQMYGGRMATVSVVESKDYLGAVKSKARTIAIAAGVGLVVAGGLSLGFTRYGVFGLKRLLPAKVSAGTPAYAQLESAKKALLSDTFKGYKDARATTAKLLALTEYPEARAVWCQSIFYLQRHYAAASAGEIAQAKAALDGITVLGSKNPEVAKALAGAALSDHQPDQALALLTEAINRDGSNDPELALLSAEATQLKGQAKDAIGQIERLIARRPDSVKAQHALGNLYQATGDADKAEKAYQKALSLSSSHVSSAVELAAVELLVRKDLDKADAALKAALDEKMLEQLGPAEVARARALQGVLLADRFSYPEAQKALEEAIRLDPGSVFAKANLAQVLLAQHDYEKALPLFKEAQSKDPHNLEYTDGYLSTLIATGRMSDALASVGQASAAFPNNARIAFLSGRVNDALDHGVDAEKAYKRAAASDPKLYEANLYLGRFYLRSKRIADATEQLTQAAQKAPDSAAVQSGSGELSLAKGDASGAKTLFEKAVKLEPTLADAHLGLAKALYALGQVKEAKVESDKTLELDPHIQNGHLTAGWIAWKLGDLDGALAELTKAKADAPNSTDVAIANGVVKLDKGDLAGAESSLLNALSNDPVNAEANYQLARVKNAQGQYTQAIDHMRDALEHAQKRADYHYEMGVILHASKDIAGAIAEWQQAVSLDPKNADSFEEMGKVYLDQGRFDDAVASFESSLKADPKRIRAIGEEGDCFLQSTRWKDAIDRYQKALAGDPTLTALYYKVGRAYGEQGNSTEAIRWYQKATTADPENAMPFYYLGYAFKEKGKKSDAVTAFKTYLAKKPNAPDRKDIEDEIYDLQQAEH